MKSEQRFSLANKIALITGASRGIGRAAALAFASAGADVAIASRKIADLETVAAEIKKLGRDSLAVQTHLGRMDEISRLVKKVTDKFGRIDILVNNAGGSPALASAMEAEERLWDKVMDVNLKGLFFLSQAVARGMKDTGGGRIINVSSIDAFRPDHKIGVYAISKAAVVMATKVMAKEWAPYHIRVNAIAPGHVHTALFDSYLSSDVGIQEQILKRTPVKRIAEPEEIVGGMIFLASDASSFVTGETLVIDGGIMTD
jgi:NAD(P)-dependent dehydrogenase (short-subunit alcohol dehydrogenase family)